MMYIQQQTAQRYNNKGNLNNQPEYLRLRWNVVGTHLAASADDSTVTVWQRSL